MRKMSDNKTPHRSSEYDCKVRKTIPFYEFFHEETISLVKTINPGVKRWLDTGRAGQVDELSIIGRQKQKSCGRT